MDTMETGTARRGGFIGFLTTIPGILTALAGLLTAAGGVYVATNDHSKSTTQPEAKPVTVNLSVAGGAAPTVPADVDQQALRLDNASSPPQARNQPVTRLLVAAPCVLAPGQSSLN